MLTESKLAVASNTRTIPKLFKDARDFQILYLSIFLLYGVTYLGWESNTYNYLTIFAAALGTQVVGILLITRNWMSLKSAIITALGLCLLLKCNDWSSYALAGVIAIAAKFTIRFNNKHLFNPANIGIIAAVVITQDAWISPGQWGNDALLLFFVGAMASIVLLKVGRLETSLAFLGAFALANFLYTVVWLDDSFLHFWHDIKSGTLLLFTFFMITDPLTTPDNKRSRMIWAALLGIITLVLAKYSYVHTAPIWTLFFITPLTVVMDRFFKARKFAWYSDRVNPTKVLPKANRTTVIAALLLAAGCAYLSIFVYESTVPVYLVFLITPGVELVRWLRQRNSSQNLIKS